ncbi:MAG: hypothetical protein V1725_00735 [archaeon]
MNCTLCGKKVEETFLKKILGTYVRNAAGKKKVVCQNCQKQHGMAEIKSKL